MSDKTIQLWAGDSANNSDSQWGKPRLDVYLPTGPKVKNRAVIVCRGGGYQGLAEHEGAPFAKLFAMHGYTAFVLTYRVAPNRFPAGHSDLCRAIRMVRSKASEFAIDPNDVTILGFSAGGHLVSTVATQPDVHVEAEDDLAETFSARPDRLLMGYPVISFTQFPHMGSCNNLLGEGHTEQQRKQFSNELNVDANTPPTFIFFTSDDPVVPVENGLLFAMACRKHNVPIELHSFEHGPHGMGLAANDEHIGLWIKLMTNWMQKER
ncbi:MAG: alpha/beta hydrolase [Phycisphaeraceae bacterium]|nr:alpha/beta hydrolase [Phycisphaeraceae bacterium]